MKKNSIALAVSILVGASINTGCDKIKGLLKPKPAPQAENAALGTGGATNATPTPPPTAPPAAKTSVPIDYVDTMEAVRKEVERNPGASLKEIAEFANKQLAAGYGVPFTFLSLGVDAMKSLSEAETEDGSTIKFSDRDMRVMCGQKAYTVIATRIGDKKLSLRAQGKVRVASMPNEFSPASLRILSKDGLELAKIIGPSDMLPTHIAANGKEAYFTLPLTSYPTPALNAWWTKVTSDIRGGAGRLPSLVYGISSTGEIEFKTETKFYKVSGSSQAQKTIARDGTHMATFLYETGHKLEGKNLCFIFDPPTVAPVVGGPVIPPGGIGAPAPSRIAAPPPVQVKATPPNPTVVHPAASLSGGLKPGEYPGAGPNGGPPSLASGPPNIPVPPNLQGGQLKVPAPPSLPGGGSSPQLPNPVGAGGGQLGEIPGGAPKLNAIPPKPSGKGPTGPPPGM